MLSTYHDGRLPPQRAISFISQQTTNLETSSCLCFLYFQHTCNRNMDLREPTNSEMNVDDITMFENIEEDSQDPANTSVFESIEVPEVDPPHNMDRAQDDAVTRDDSPNSTSDAIYQDLESLISQTIEIYSMVYKDLNQDTTNVSARTSDLLNVVSDPYGTGTDFAYDDF